MLASWDEILLRTAVVQRRKFFKIWNQLTDAEIFFDTPYSKVQKTLGSLDEIPPAISLPSDVRFISMVNPLYPPSFWQLPQPPLGLFVQGQFEHRHLAGIIGSRKPTAYARRRARDCSRLLVEQNYGIVSGGAIGIDGEAHHAALEAGGLTYVVLGGGVRHLHPKSHERLFARILESGGGLLSEYPPHAEPRPWTFPERNRLIAALSELVILAQAHEKSGSLSTARTALDLGKEIFVLRPVMGDPAFLGSQALLDEGARCLNVPSELVAELSLARDLNILDQTAPI